MSSEAAHREGPPSSSRRVPGYTLMFAGQRTAKTALIRLLVDSLNVAPTATDDQAHAMAKFVLGAQQPTPAIRSVSLDVLLPGLSSSSSSSSPRSAHAEPVELTLIDTPALDLADEPGLDRAVLELVGHIEERYRRTMREEHDARAADQQVHLCVYLLDPDKIVPTPAALPPRRPHTAPGGDHALHRHLQRDRQHPLDSDAEDMDELASDEEAQYASRRGATTAAERPTMLQLELSILRRLSTRVNVLPVIARADALTNDRLETIKRAVLRDLAGAGLGFGIFDPANLRRTASPTDYAAQQRSAIPEDRHGPSSATSPTLGRQQDKSAIPLLPYALVTPDVYVWGDGVQRADADLSREQLLRRYSHDPQLPDKMAPGRFSRRYRWGVVDVLDPRHCDFVPFREAVFAHMQTLKNYTREHLFASWRTDAMNAAAAPPGAAREGHVAHPHTVSPPLSHRHPSALGSYGFVGSGDLRGMGDLLRGAGTAPPGAPFIPGTSQYTLATGVPKVRQKKILVACNFCRTRKLKCDGGRPACAQCVKRSNQCDYQPVVKRRGMGKSFKEEDGSEEGASHGQSALHDGSHTHGHPHDAAHAHALPSSASFAALADRASDRRSATPTSTDEAESQSTYVLDRERMGPGPVPRMSVHQLVGATGSVAGPKLSPLLTPIRTHPRSDYGDYSRERVEVDRDYSDRRDSDFVDRDYADRHVDREYDRLDRDAYHHEREREQQAYEYERERAYEREEQERRARRASLTSVLPPPTGDVRRPQEPLPPVSQIAAGLASHLQPGAKAFPPPVRLLGDSDGGGHVLARPDTSPLLSEKGAAVGSIEKKKAAARRAGSNYGPKTVACNFCRTRKTKCDGQHPKCGNCLKRNLACEYLEDQRRRPHAHHAEGGDDASGQTKLKRLAPAPPAAGAPLSAGSGSSGGGGGSENALPSLRDQVPATAFGKRKSAGDEMIPSPLLKKLKFGEEPLERERERERFRVLDDIRPRAVTGPLW